MNRITIDLESIPSGEYEPEEYSEKAPTLEDVPEHGSMKDPKKILLWKEKKLESMYKEYEFEFQKHMVQDMKAYKNRSLNFNTNQIVSISVKINGNPVQNFSGADETPILKEFCEYIYGNNTGTETYLWVGHYIKEFDFPVLRAKIQRLSTWYKVNKPNEQNIFGALLKEGWFLPDVKPYLAGVPNCFDFFFHLPSTSAKYKDSDGKMVTGKSLDAILKYYGLKGKEDVSGEDVLSLWEDGRLDLIREYNIDEVQQMSELFDSLDYWWSEQVDWRVKK